MRAAQGRGRLSSLDLIPEDGYDDIVWAREELNQRRRTQADILFELNDRLAVKGIDPISKSAFHRAAVRAAIVARKLAEARAVFAGVAKQFTPGETDESNLALGELIKMLIQELLEQPDHTPKQAMEMARALLATVQAQSLSSSRRLKLEADMRAKMTEAVDKVAGEKGMSAETIARIKSQILGVRV